MWRVVELGYLCSRYCPSCFSISFFHCKLLFIFKMDFISIFHACGSRDDPPLRYPRSACCLLWLNFSGESLYHDFQETTHFNSLHLKHFRWVLERRSIALSKAAVSRTSKLVSHSSFLLVTLEKLDLKKKNNVVQILDATRLLLSHYFIVNDINDIHPATFQ